MFQFPWRFLIGVVVGAILVKESRGAEKLYETAREKAVSGFDKQRMKRTEDLSMETS